MTTCKDCISASLSWTWGGYTASCDGCNVRGIAVSPKFVREHHYQMVLEKEGKDSMDERKRAISAEWGRIQRMKERQSESSED